MLWTLLFFGHGLAHVLRQQDTLTCTDGTSLQSRNYVENFNIYDYGAGPLCAPGFSYDNKFDVGIVNWAAVLNKDLDPPPADVTTPADPYDNVVMASTKRTGTSSIKALDASTSLTKKTNRYTLKDMYFQCRTYVYNEQNEDAAESTCSEMAMAVTCGMKVKCERDTGDEVSQTFSYSKTDAEGKNLKKATFNDDFKNLLSCDFSAVQPPPAELDRVSIVAVRLHIKLLNYAIRLFLGLFLSDDDKAKKYVENSDVDAALIVDNISMVITECQPSDEGP